MKMFVEPEHSLNGRPSAVATCSSTRTLVVPTAMTLLALLTARAAASGRTGSKNGRFGLLAGVYV